MSAVNKVVWLKNLQGDKQPLVMLGLFQAGATQAVKRGELLELSSGNWVPLGSDKAMAGIIAIANEEIKSGDLAGYYEIIVPRPGDVFEFALAAGSAIAVGTALYFSDSQTLTVTAGTNILAYAVGQTNYPLKQGHTSADATGDMGTTIRSVKKAEVCIKQAASYYAALNV